MATMPQQQALLIVAGDGNATTAVTGARIQFVGCGNVEGQFPDVWGQGDHFKRRSSIHQLQYYCRSGEQTASELRPPIPSLAVQQ